MHLLEIKVSGFKSFVDSVTFPINEGLSGIVGPNGCGKSNIFESIRWVMGANSARALRGTEMDDVIFAGSGKRPPRDIAEVILKVDNSDHTAPEPFRMDTILEVSRRIKRGSGSTYRINGKEVRAKDVQLLFADASSGANSPALVRQGQVSELINAKPENRRKVLEEASGISGLQARRHEAISKLNATEANLERVSEIILTLEDGISSLKKQAVKAEKYRGLADVIKGLEAYVAHHKYISQTNDINQCKENIKSLQIGISELDKKLSEHALIAKNLEAHIPQAKQETAIANAILGQIEIKKFAFDRDLQEAREKFNSSQQNLTRTSKDLERENELMLEASQFITQAQAELEPLLQAQLPEDEVNALEQDALEISQRISNLEALINNISEQNSDDKNQLLIMRQNLARQNDEKIRLVNNYNRLANELNVAKSASISDATIENAKGTLKSAIDTIEKAESDYNSLLKTLQDSEAKEQIIRKEHDDLSSKINSLNTGINALKSVIGNSKNQNSLLDIIEVKAGYEKAFTAAFGEDLDAQIATGEIYWLPAEIPNIAWGKELSDATSLSEVAKYPTELSAKLHTVKVVSNELFSATKTLPLGCQITTIDGDMKRWDGLVKTSKAPNTQAKLFEQRNKIKLLEDELAPLLPILPQKAKELANIKREVQSLRQSSNNERAKHPKLMMAVQNAQKTLNDLIGKQARELDKIKLISDNIAQFKSNLDAISDEVDSGTLKTNKLETELKDKQAQDAIKLEQSKSELSQLRQELADKRAYKQRIKSEADRRKKAISNLESQLQTYVSRQDKCKKRIAELSSEAEFLKSEIITLKDRPQKIEQERQAALVDLPNTNARKEAAYKALSKLEQNLQTNNNEINRLSLELATQKEKLSAQGDNLSSKADLLTALIAEISENYECQPQELPQALYEYATQRIGGNSDNLTLEKVQSRLQKSRSDRENLGGVNLNADLELREQNNKVETMSSERNELLSAVKKLRKSIDEINAEGREKLIKAFDVVNGHFSELFTTLFGGGEAYLSLTETDDPLGGGLEVYACPPGKRLQSMSLMSGGEQALTAMALIFAVFLSNPAPLSVMDEIDAPLDDANVERFCALMEEIRRRTDTRFIVITHHPITMAKMDRLFGITMAEKGVSTLVSVDLSRAESMINADETPN